jgi:hypothetical protein
MKQKAIEDETSIPYLTDVRIWGGPFFFEPWSDYTLYLTLLGSPETALTDQGDVYATHIVAMTATIRLTTPGDEGHIVGRTGSSKGITEFVDDTLAFFSGNLLGLSSDDGIEVGFPPVCEAPADAYRPDPVDDETWLLTARMIYRARTRPFRRAA